MRPFTKGQAVMITRDRRRTHADLWHKKGTIATIRKVGNCARRRCPNVEKYGCTQQDVLLNEIKRIGDAHFCAYRFDPIGNTNYGKEDDA
jgi:hypothetical protein